MSGTEDMGSAWAERTLAVLLLPFAFIVMLGGGAGLIWLWQDYRAQFWIGACVVAILAVGLSAGVSAYQRQERRTRWLAGRARITDGYDYADDYADPGSDRDLMLDVLSRVESMQQNMNVLMGEFGEEQQRAGSGRHAGPVLVDIRDDVDDFDDDFEDDAGSDEFDDYSDIDTRGETDDNEPDLMATDAHDDRDHDSLDDDEFDDGHRAPMDEADAEAAPPMPPMPPVPPSPRNGEPQPERRMRRLVRDRGRQVDAVPSPRDPAAHEAGPYESAQREPVQVIELPRDGDVSALPDTDEDDEEYYGEDFNEDLYDETEPAEGDLDENDDDPRDGGRRRRDAR